MVWIARKVASISNTRCVSRLASKLPGNPLSARGGIGDEIELLKCRAPDGFRSARSRRTEKVISMNKM